MGRMCGRKGRGSGWVHVHISPADMSRLLALVCRAHAVGPRRRMRGGRGGRGTGEGARGGAGRLSLTCAGWSGVVRPSLPRTSIIRSHSTPSSRASLRAPGRRGQGRERRGDGEMAQGVGWPLEPGGRTGRASLRAPGPHAARVARSLRWWFDEATRRPRAFRCRVRTDEPGAPPPTTCAFSPSPLLPLPCPLLAGQL